MIGFCVSINSRAASFSNTSCNSPIIWPTILGIARVPCFHSTPSFATDPCTAAAQQVTVWVKPTILTAHDKMMITSRILANWVLKVSWTSNLRLKPFPSFVSAVYWGASPSGPARRFCKILFSIRWMPALVFSASICPAAVFVSSSQISERDEIISPHALTAPPNCSRAAELAYLNTKSVKQLFLP